jgi:hypothetical protein
LLELQHTGLQIADLFQDLLGLPVIIPKVFGQGGLLQSLYFLLFISDVKGTPSSH